MNSRYNNAVKLFDEYNAADPHGKEVLYAQRMSERLEKFKPDAPEHVRLAIRCQHIGRWQIPRNTYPNGKKGYIAWRNKLKDHHAAIAGGILEKVGYDKAMIDMVQDLLEKKDLRNNPNTQLLEDVVCLVFVEFYLEEFAAKHDDEKVIDILSRTFKKMTQHAIDVASTFNLPPHAKDLLSKAASR
ncbi:MAG TPA: DUF4202 domain-containing protein [Cyclobacteriaceae bacterium]|nr:DUF4202 domain-containing protein [Cyclobacteriaceae bacterium]